ncbi:class I SAM-dependent methyltransferase [Evansella sp. AB-P1]|uniref:class I SAM-dependent methyltransferase n=1 Tax=Evansella sp. AB-P1 TaxID=3037653 RepID=UPI00241BF431|nr:class I SAM-dependent methyltransferase [Evansella sp. AB-P1]MDG5789033.1 class I SAM-dependent methyltransferase [Evansella sp. AB-P1]
MEAIVTTAGRPSLYTIVQAKEIARKLAIPYVERNKRSVSALIKNYKVGVIVVGKDKVSFQSETDEQPFFFHPNSAMFRAKRWLKSMDDPFIQACRLEEGDYFFDGTLGLGSDAILASLAVGDSGKVIGTELSPIIAFIVQNGLQTYESPVTAINLALRRITVLHMSYMDCLKNMANNSMDVVYFDPMFENKVVGSDGLDKMRALTTITPLTKETIVEAKRVASKRIVLKDHFRSERFSQFDFNVDVRPSATYHFGTIELEEK